MKEIWNKGEDVDTGVQGNRINRNNYNAPIMDLPRTRMISPANCHYR